NWAEIVTPSVFSLGTTAEVLIWVIVGGLGTLIGPMIAAVALGSLKLELGHQTTVDNSLVLGAILILVVLLIPRGFAPSFVAWRRRFAQSQVHRRLGGSTRRRPLAPQEGKKGASRSSRPRSWRCALAACSRSITSISCCANASCVASSARTGRARARFSNPSPAKSAAPMPA